MDAVTMSLDDIIKEKKNYGSNKKVSTHNISSPVKKKTFPTKKTISIKNNRLGTLKKNVRSKQIVDARNKIIQKNRSKICDAREKLAQIAKQSGDVRLKLLRKMHCREESFSINHKHLGYLDQSIRKRSTSYLDVNRHHAGLYSHRDVRRIDLDMDDELVPTFSLRRTVQNDIAYTKMPPLPIFPRRDTPLMPDPHSTGVRDYAPIQRTNRRQTPIDASLTSPWTSDPFDCYEVPIRRPVDISEPKNLRRQIHNESSELVPSKGILRYSRDVRNSASPPLSHHVTYPKIFAPRQYADESIDDSHLSYEMRTRLERAPDSNVSMGIFSNPYILSNKPSEVYVSASQVNLPGYRIVVSNLHNSVSQSDIRELFEDIGQLVEARLVRPGVAEVIFRTMKDAEQAVDTYHNRQLDGQPMKCLLVNPRSSSKPTAPAIKSGHSNHISKSSKTPLEIDIDALHKVLFQPKLYSRNPKQH